MKSETFPSESAPMDNKEKKVEQVAKYHKITDADKQEGIPVYGEKPLGGEEVVRKSAKNIQRELGTLQKMWKSPDYVGDKNDLERQILSREEELRKLTRKLKTSKELVADGSIAWDKGDEGEEILKTSEASESTSVESAVPEKETAEVVGEPEKSKEAEKTGEIEKPEGTEKSENVSPSAEKEKKEMHSEQELLNAAEILCKYQPGAHKTPEEEETAKKRALEGLKGFSEGVISKAVEVAGIRNRFRDIKDVVKITKAEYKTAMDNPSVDQTTATAKYEQRITNIKTQMRILENDFDPALIALKVAYLRDEGQKLKKYVTHEDFKEKVTNLELSAFSLMTTEMARWQDAEIINNHTMNPTGWDHVKNFFRRASETKGFQWYQKMGRHKRTALSAAVVGGATALLVPSIVTAAGIGTVGYMAWKGFRSFVGADASYFASKKITQPLIQKDYERKGRKSRNVVETGIAESGAVDDLEKLIRGDLGDEKTNETLERIGTLNRSLAKAYAEDMRRNKKAFVRNNIIGTVLTGLLVGGGTAYAMEKLIAPEFIALIGGGAHVSPAIEQTPGGGAKEVIPPAVGGGAHETMPDWNFETAKSGDSVWRVIEHDLQHNVKGFNELPKAQQTYIIDHYKDLVVADPEKFGLHDPNLIQQGWGKEINTLFEGKTGQAELDRWMGKAGNLTPEQMQHISEYNMKPTVFHPDVPVHTTEAVTMVETSHGGGVGGIQNLDSNAIPFVMTPVEHVFSRPEILLDLDKAVPHFAETATQFPHLSLAEQEHILSSPVVARVAGELHHLNQFGTGLTGSETDVMGEINKHWTSMMDTYTENSQSFTNALHGATGLEQANVHPFLSTTVDKVLDTYGGNDKVLDFVRTINPTSNELASHVSVEEVLKNRFVDGHFGKVNLDQYVSGGWKE